MTKKEENRTNIIWKHKIIIIIMRKIFKPIEHGEDIITRTDINDLYNESSISTMIKTGRFRLRCYSQRMEGSKVLGGFSRGRRPKGRPWNRCLGVGDGELPANKSDVRLLWRQSPT